VTSERAVAIDFYRHDVLKLLRYREEMEANPRMAMAVRVESVTDAPQRTSDNAERALIRKADIDKVLNELPAEQRKMGRMLGQGYCFADIARELHATEYAIGYRAKTLLRKLTLSFHQHHILRDHYGYLS
jgi:DNA-binding NarL/FixJ family response regulator